MEKIIEIPEGYDARIEGNKVVLEPKESVDERIRKFLIQHISEWIGCIEHDLKISSKDIESEKELAMFKAGLAYLEKQKEQKVDIDKLRKDIYQSGYDDGYQHGKEDAQKEQKPKHFELKAGKWYICHRAFCCRADHLTVKEGERFMCEKDRVVKGFVIKEPEKYFIECSAPAPMEDEQKEQKPVNGHPVFRVGDYIRNKRTGDKVLIEQIDVKFKCYYYVSSNGVADVHSDLSWAEQDNWELIGQEIEQKPAECTVPHSAIYDHFMFNLHTIIYNYGKQIATKCLGTHVLDTKLNEYVTDEDVDKYIKKHISCFVSLYPLLTPAEWSEEDERNLNMLIDYFEHYHIPDNAMNKIIVKWLKSLRPQPKQESEPIEIKYAGKIYKVYGTKELPGGVVGYIIEDEPGHYDCIIHPDEVLGGGYGIKSNGSPYPTKEANFGQSHWKPSEIQMKALLSKLPVVKGGGDKVQDILESLYDDLKKLL